MSFAPPKTLRQLGGGGAVQIVGTRTGSNTQGLTAGGQKRTIMRSRHILPHGATNLQLVLPGWYQYAVPKLELPCPVSVFAVNRAVPLAGGTGYAVGDYWVGPVAGVGMYPVVLRVLAVNAGAITKVEVVEGGVYGTQIADGVAQMCTWGASSGHGAYAEFTVTSGGGINALSNLWGGAEHTGTPTATIVAFAGSGVTPTLTFTNGTLTGVSTSGSSTTFVQANNPPVLAVNTGAGTGATFTFDWTGYAYAVAISIEPVFKTELASGVNAAIPVFGPEGPSQLHGWPKMIMVKPGDTVTTQPIEAQIPAGGVIGVRMTGYGQIPTGLICLVHGEQQSQAQDYPNYAQVTSSSTFGNSLSTGDTMLEFAGMIGQKVVAGPSMMLIGDSRTFGNTGASTTDNADSTYGQQGAIERAINQLVPYTNISCGGDEINWWVTYGMQQRLKSIKAVGGCPALVYHALNFNDMNAGGFSYAQVLAMEIQMVQMLRAMGAAYVITSTTDPYTNSTDSWATLTNQTTTSSNTGIQARNTALRLGSVSANGAGNGLWTPGGGSAFFGIYDGYFDHSYSGYSESALASGKWAISATTDGTHCSTANTGLLGTWLQPAMAAAIGLAAAL